MSGQSGQPLLRDLDPEALRQLASRARQRGRNAARRDTNAIPIVDRGGRLPLSFAQQQLWLLTQLDGGSSNYHIDVALRLRGRLDIGAWRRSLDRLFSRHEALRTVFVAEDGEPRIALLPSDASLPLEMHDLRGRPDREKRLSDVLDECTRAPFDLARGPLIRSHLIRLGDDDHVVLLSQHHIISDGWSMGVIVRELSALYGAFAAGGDDPLPPLAIQYPDYAAWQRHSLTADRLQRQLDHWTAVLRDAPSLLALPTDRTRSAPRSNAGAAVPVEIDDGLSADIRRLGHALGATPFVIVLAAWAIVLSRLAGQQDLVIGTPSANRMRSELEGLAGFFVNMLALRLDLSQGPAVAELIDRVKTAVLAAQDHQDLPFEHLVEALQPPRHPEYTPVFQVVFAWQSNDVGSFALPGLAVERLAIEQHKIKFDLELDLSESGGRISGKLNYATALFDADTVQRYRFYLLAALRAMVADTSQPVDRIELLPAEERTLLLDVWNRTQSFTPADCCVQELVAEQARRRPSAVALVHGAVSLSYRELEERANRLAHHLVALGAGPDRLVAICQQRGIDAIVSVLAVLKAGAAYLPLDPAYPPQRLRETVADAQPTLLLCDGESASTLGSVAHPVIDVESDAPAWSGLPESAPDVAARGLTPRNLAYVIYTSGSTGQPKGVMVEHQGLVNLAQAQIGLFDTGPHSRIVQFASFSFDASVWDIVMALCAGAELHLLGSREHRDAPELLNYLVEHRITHATLPPAMLQGRSDLARLSGLEVLVLAGELPRPELFEALPPEIAVFNAYGPTEATVCATAWRRPPGFAGGVVPIGRPIANARIYLLDAQGMPVPRGAVGEIWIGGAGVARGYLNRPDLSAQRFAADPFDRSADARMYRTGDLGRHLADGNIEFLGRNDHQVKIRGFRIELGEIEHRLNAQAGVRDSAVLARRDAQGDLRLIAYVVPAEDADGTGAWAAKLRLHLQGSLPDYMVPSAIVRLPAFPLTPNGKVDRQALPAPDDEAFSHATYDPPQGEAEQTLAAIWCELLGVERVGRNDHFFELGGHSLLVVRMLDRLKHHALTIDAQMVFAKPVLRDLAASLRQSEETAIPDNPITAQSPVITSDMLPLIALSQDEIDRVVGRVPGGVANVQDIYTLSPLQEGILFHHLLATEGDPYVLVAQMAFAGRDLLDRYLAAVQDVIDRHDVLRTSFLWDGLSVPAQVVWRQAPLSVTEVELEGNAPAQVELARRFDPKSCRLDLTQAPLLRLVVARDPGSDRLLLLVVLHHMVGDHSTLQALHEEVQLILSGRRTALPPPIPFRNLVAETRKPGGQDAQQRFFRSMLADIDAPTAPFGLIEVRSDGAGVREAKLPLPAALDARLRAQARRLGASLASLCHVAWGQVLARSSGREQVVFGTVLLGRMQAGHDTGRSLGLFINTLPLRLDLDGTSVEDSVRAAHARLAELTAHEHASLAMAQRCSGVAPPTPLFSAILNYRHGQRQDARADAQPIQALRGVEWLGGEERTNYPLMLAVDDGGHGLHLTVQAVAPVAPERVGAMMQQSLDRLALALEAAPHTPVRQLDVVPVDDRARLLRAWNATAVSFADTLCVHRQFEVHAARSPDAVALVYGQETISYGALNARANRLARRLRDRGIGPDVVVGLALERGVTMMVALLAVLKAGGAYLPLDPDYPAERLAHMLNDSGAKLLLTQATLHDRFAPVLARSEAEAWLLEVAAGEGLGQTDNLAVDVHPESLAYVIYTSGSTGRPKGVMVRHAAVTNFLTTMAEQPGIAADDRVLALTSLSFDIAVLELWLPLTHGARIVLADRFTAHDPVALKAMVARHGVTMVQATPSSWRMLLDHDAADPHETAPWLPKGCRLLSGGEALASDLARRLGALGSEVWNVYGPTETTVWSARHRLDATDPLPLLGSPIGNTRLYVLDTELNLAPVGVAGELFIGGDGLARGYWKRAALSAGRFIPDPFGSDGARLYRTGDLARWRADGVLDYVGRADHQVKIRGHRIELGEIEVRLREQPGVRDSVVVAQELGGGRQLVGYVSGEDTLDGGGLRAALAAALPDYMVPSRVIVLPELPLTPNGKIDRNALPRPDVGAPEAHRIAPRNPTEAALAAIWAELLHRPDVGVTDNFFELGGDSLMAVQLVGRIKRDLAWELPLKRLFELTTVEAMASALAADPPTSRRSDDIAAMFDLLEEVEFANE
ncbi:non-ribosomal peptide synthetase [Bradyrhizobium sp. SZCCHNRI2007]|uniref:non-ribosomal peptide synthetase n=1 Tax=Bradyrhizobium sp. SZCCHNRI2007 TaxID=3057281 RepID=UPI0028F06AAC|nr:non-ribosomal peptide synthetase [Bradyrhizobium sp. SZCCHNRI2007]